jgi:hypothetical protein
LYTNEGILPKGGANALGFGPAPSSSQPLGAGTGKGAQGTTPAEALASLDNAQVKLDRALEVIDAVAAADRATFVSTILEGNNSDFPGRKQWEDRLMAGRDYYVSHGRQLIQMMKQLMAYAKSMAINEPNVSESDARVLTLMKRVKEGYEDAQKTADDFKRLVEEGPALAKQYRARQD